MEYQNDKIDAFDNENNQDIINDEMSNVDIAKNIGCLFYTSPSPRD